MLTNTDISIRKNLSVGKVNRHIDILLIETSQVAKLFINNPGEKNLMQLNRLYLNLEQFVSELKDLSSSNETSENLFREGQFHFRSILTDILMAQEKKDWLQLKDLIDHSLPDNLYMWKLFILPQARVNQ